MEACWNPTDDTKHVCPACSVDAGTASNEVGIYLIMIMYMQDDVIRTTGVDGPY